MTKKIRENATFLFVALRTTVACWFFAGMALDMLLRGIYFTLTTPAPPLLFFLSTLVYLSGSLLGCWWSIENLLHLKKSWIDYAGILVVLVLSLCFLLTSIEFGMQGFQSIL